MERTPLSRLRECVETGPPYEPAFLDMLRGDARAGAQALYRQCRRRLERNDAEASRIDGMMRLEREAAAHGFRRVAGIDEAGRGPLAGPIAAAAVVLREPVAGLDDSKRLSPDQRARLFDRLHADGHAIGVALIAPEDIDRAGIQSANYRAMLEAAARLDPAPDFLLVDGFSIPGCLIPHRRVVKGDRLSQSIAAASIVAKVTRDRIMDELDRRHPEYGFARHKGYATADHLEALRRFGPCPAHRRSFAPLAQSPRTGSLFAANQKDAVSCDV